jgi:uncharacterized protein YbjT (DUF2867 family)
MSKPLILVFGATGAQGSSVVDSLLKPDAFSLRAVTRNPSSDNAQALASVALKWWPAISMLALLNLSTKAYVFLTIELYCEKASFD